MDEYEKLRVEAELIEGPPIGDFRTQVAGRETYWLDERQISPEEYEQRHGGRLPDPGVAVLCERCGEPREAHGGRRHLGLCPDQSGLYGKRFRLTSAPAT